MGTLFLKNFNIVKLSIVWIYLLSLTAHATNSISLYGGIQTAPQSKVSGTDQWGDPFNFTAQWEGRSFTGSPYYGLRYIHWIDDGIGLSVDFVHAKVYASSKTLNRVGFKVLEFSDGLNLLTVSCLRKYLNNIYWGIGAGISIPHVEVRTEVTSSKTFQYQFGGYTLQAQVGWERSLSHDWSIFTEYKFNYTRNDVDLEGGGELRSSIVINALNVGVSYRL